MMVASFKKNFGGAEILEKGHTENTLYLGRRVKAWG
jgi:hypothetical protein